MKNLYYKIILNISKDIHFKEILKGASFSLIAKVLAITIGLVINIFISRYYGANIIGLLSIINSFLALSLIFSLMGTQVSVLRFIPEHITKFSYNSAYHIYLKIIKLIFLSSSILFIFIYFFAEYIAEYIFHKPYLTPFLILSAVFIVILSLITLNARVFRALKALKVFALFQVLPSIVNFIILLIMTFTAYHIYNPIYSQFLAYFIIMSLSLYIINQMFKKHKISNQNISDLSYQDILQVSLPMFLSSGMTVVIAETDTIMLGAMTSNTEVGIYAMASKLALLIVFMRTAINTISAPKISELFHAGEIHILEKTTKKISKFIFLSSLPIGLILIFFGKYILAIFGHEFIEGYSVLVLLSIGQLFSASMGSIGTFLNMTGYEKQLRNIVIFGGILNIVLNFILIPIYGIVGAAIASMVSIIIWHFISYYLVYNKFGFFIGFLRWSKRL